MSPHLARCLLSSFLLAATALGADAEAPMKKEAEAPATAPAPADAAKPANEAATAKPAMTEKPADRELACVRYNAEKETP
jgi:hypothetical protein